jgi:hypothetical protein
MSLGIAFKGPEGIVLAVDSRITLKTHRQVGPTGKSSLQGQTIFEAATYDNATNLLKVKGQDHVAAVTFGAGAIGTQAPRTVHSFMPEFETRLSAEPEARLSVEAFAAKLGDFFLTQWNALMPDSTSPQEQITFFVGGLDPGAAYGRVFEVNIPSAPKPKEWHSTAGEFGIIWGGQRAFADRLLNGYDSQILDILKSEVSIPRDAEERLTTKLAQLIVPIPFQFLPLQDSIDLCIFLIRATITLQSLQIGMRDVGGAIDVATITRSNGFQTVQRKALRGEIE